jgi:hypothetical protein
MSEPAPAEKGRATRRLVLLEGEEQSSVERVLLEYAPAEVRDSRLIADLQRFADEHRGKHVAAEWLAPLGWTRFLWCRR